MPRSEPLVEIAKYLEAPQVVPIEEIRKFNPQRDVFEMLQGLVHFDREEVLGIGYHDVREEEFWVSGHIPGRPLFPGVLQVETAAQLCSYMYHNCMPPAEGPTFFGFAGIEACRFMGEVVPGDRLHVVAKGRKLRKKLAIFDTQCFVGETHVFEAVIKGAPI